MKIKSFLFIIFYYLISVTSVYAIDPEVFVQSTVNRASKVLGEDISKEKKMLELQNIAKDTVDINGIGFYTLGSIRKTIDENQKEIYANLFENILKATQQACRYTDPEIDVIGKETLNENYTIVNSILKATNEDRIKIDWRFTKNKDKPLINLIIEGLSLARTQKEEFNSVLQSNNNDISELFKTLKTFINN